MSLDQSTILYPASVLILDRFASNCPPITQNRIRTRFLTVSLVYCSAGDLTQSRNTAMAVKDQKEVRERIERPEWQKPSYV